MFVDTDDGMERLCVRFRVCVCVCVCVMNGTDIKPPLVIPTVYIYLNALILWFTGTLLDIIF